MPLHMVMHDGAVLTFDAKFDSDNPWTACNPDSHIGGHTLNTDDLKMWLRKFKVLEKL